MLLFCGGPPWANDCLPRLVYSQQTKMLAESDLPRNVLYGGYGARTRDAVHLFPGYRDSQ